MLRFVLLRHECPPDYRDGPHWDLMVERPEAAGVEHRLATWSLLELPTLWGPTRWGDDPDDPITATELPDHRARYLDYEGPVSGGRGDVRRVAAGEAVWLECSPGAAVIRLVGPPPHLGIVTLARQTGEDWRLMWEPTTNDPIG